MYGFFPYPRRLESITICRCHYKGSTFFSVLSLKTLIVDQSVWICHIPRSRLMLSQLGSSGGIYCFARRLIASPKVAKRMIDYRECSVIGLCFSCRKESWIDSEAVATGVCRGRLVSTFCYSVWWFGSTCVSSQCSARNGWRSSVQASTCSMWELIISIDCLLHTVLTHLHFMYSCFMFLHQSFKDNMCTFSMLFNALHFLWAVFVFLCFVSNCAHIVDGSSSNVLQY